MEQRKDQSNLSEHSKEHLKEATGLPVQIPSVGRIVHFYPKSQYDKHLQANGAKFLPAIVVQTFSEMSCNLSVYTACQEFPVVIRFSVPHLKDTKAMTNAEGEITISYWEWPPRQ